MDDLVVTVKQGKLKGVVQQSTLGPSYFAFRGIPYAAPPVGELRFKDPVPPAAWTGIRDASKNCGTICAQYCEAQNIGIRGGEDCLYLNVYTTSLTERKPVMVWIHGGGFVQGNGNDTEKRPDYLITKDVVIVSVNYRLGAFGFLNLGHKVAPGNQALKDLILSLKWVKENIANFGGDSNNVTLFGNSAGGALVHFLIISPAAKGLMHKAICQSGLAIHDWASGDIGSKYSFKLAAACGLNSTDPVEVLEFLQTVPWRKIVEEQRQLLTLEERCLFRIPFGCTTDSIADDPVLPLPLNELLDIDSDIPLLIGYTTEEFVMFMKTGSKEELAIFDKYLPEYVANFATTKDPAELDRINKKLREQYLDEKPLGPEHIPNVINLMSQLVIIQHVIRFGEHRRQRKCAPTYVYKFSYIGNEKCATDLLVKKRVMPGASHADEIAYLFYLTRCKVDNPDAPAPGTKDRIVMERMIRMWTNFAKTGNPTSVQDEYVNITWEPVTERSFKCLNIGEELEMVPMEPDITL